MTYVPWQGDAHSQETTSRPRIAFSSLGCKVNASETESFISSFLARGYIVVPFDAEAEVYVINTCTVTSVADRKSRQEIRQAARANPLALVAATGCYVSVAHRNLEGLVPGNLLVIHNLEKDQLVDRVDAELALRQSCTGSAMTATQGPRQLHGRSGAPAPLLPVAVGADTQRTRATLKIQDGCNAGCSFCIIPRARGGPRSVLLDDVVRAAVALEERGYREIVLTGVLLGSYGSDLPLQPDLATLIRSILQASTRLRIRISSIEPQDLRPEWLDLWADSRLCRHLHIPLQSGSDTILAAMRRKYDTAYFRDLVATARRRICDLALTTDILVGFPGEHEAAFAETLCFATDLAFAGIHVFRYSMRPGTLAARLSNQVPEREKASRSEQLRALAIEGRQAFHARFMGMAHTVLWEHAHEGIWHGLTDNYLHAYTRADRDLHNQVAPVVLRAPYADGLWADLSEAEPGR